MTYFREDSDSSVSEDEYINSESECEDSEYELRFSDKSKESSIDSNLVDNYDTIDLVSEEEE